MSEENTPQVAPLFRIEAIDSRKETWLGRPLVLSPIPLRFVMWLGVAATIAIISFLAFGSYTQRVRLYGVVATSAGIVRVFAPQDGRITGNALEENSAVSEKQRLFVLDVTNDTSLGDTQSLVAEELEIERDHVMAEISRSAKLEDIEKSALQRSLDSLQQELVQLAAETKRVEVQVADLKSTVGHYRSYIRSGLSTKDDLDERKDRYQRAMAHLESLHRNAIELDRKEEEMEIQQSVLGLRAESDRNSLKRNLAELRRSLVETLALKEEHILAPIAGVVTAILVKPGQMVERHAPLLSILPDDSKLEINLEASSSAIVFVREKSRVTLRYKAFPYQKYGQQNGKVTSVSRVPIGNGNAGKEGLYRITIQPEDSAIQVNGQMEPLQPGMQVEADILLENRYLYEWVLGPAISLRDRIASRTEIQHSSVPGNPEI